MGVGLTPASAPPTGSGAAGSGRYSLIPHYHGCFHGGRSVYAVDFRLSSAERHQAEMGDQWSNDVARRSHADEARRQWPTGANPGREPRPDGSFTGYRTDGGEGPQVNDALMRQQRNQASEIQELRNLVGSLKVERDRSDEETRRLRATVALLQLQKPERRKDPEPEGDLSAFIGPALVLGAYGAYGLYASRRNAAPAPAPAPPPAQTIPSTGGISSPVRCKRLRLAKYLPANIRQSMLDPESDPAP